MDMSILDTKTATKVIDIIHGITQIKPATSEVKSNGDLHVIKGESGYKWLAVYTNSFRDDDGVPEIIQSHSHKSFVDNVDKGNYDYPELQLWHNPLWKFGKATVVAYDEVEPGIVFGIAGGNIDVGKEYVADALLASDIPFRLSHGMPTDGIVRDSIDSTLYDKHITTEITVLPTEFAANQLTGFGLFGEEAMIDSTKKAEIMGTLGIDPSVLTQLEASNKAIADREKVTREYKETSPVNKNVGETTVAQPETDTVETVTEEVTNTVQETPNTELNIQDILDQNKSNMDVVTADIAEIKSALDVVAEALGTIAVAQKNITERVETVEQVKEDQVKAQTPTFSAAYKDRISSIVGQPDAVVHKEKDQIPLTGPQQNPANKQNTAFGSTFLGDLVAKSNSR